MNGRYKITPLQKKILRWVARKIVIQSHRHQSNIVTYYKIIIEAAREEFVEDTRPSLDAFLSECHQEALDL